jgi:hypothetical protein
LAGDYGPSNGVWLLVSGLSVAIHFLVVPLVLGTGYGGRVAAAQLLGFATMAAVTAAAATPFVIAARREAMLIRRLDQVRQIGFAVGEFDNEHSYPPKAAIYSKDGKPLLSWRVQILPYLDQQPLYEQFRLDEPWDSEHNSALVRLMPAVFATQGEDPQQGMTRLRGFSGRDNATDGRGAFRDDRRPGGGGYRFHEYVDSRSETILIAEVRESIVWTRPDDLPLAGAEGLPEFGIPSDDRWFAAAFADHHVEAVRRDRPKSEIRALLTIDGREQPAPRD